MSSTQSETLRRTSAAIIERLEGRLLLAAGDLDTSLTGTGKLLDSSKAGANAVLVQSDGKILVAGGAAESGYIARYNNNGNIDVGFGPGGTGFRETDNTSDMVFVSGGKFVAVGGGYINRYSLTDGSPDANFTPSALNHTAIIQRITSAPGDKLVVAAQNSFDDIIYLYRFNSDGSYDNNFGFMGEAEVPALGQNSLRDVVVQSDSKIVIVARRVVGAVTQMCVVRMEADGKMSDETFGNTASPFGLAFADFGASAFGYDVVLQPDGRIVACGPGGGGANWAAARWTNTGQLDPDFSVDGKVNTTPFEGVSSGFGAQALALQKNGKIVVTGLVGENFAVARYLPNGILDNGFGGGDGTVLTDMGGFDWAQQIAISPDGSIVVAGVGDTTNTLAIARYVGDPTGSIAGNVWNDSNSNSTKDGAETGIAGWTLFLDTNNDNVLDAGERSVTTDAGGNYTFFDLTAGTYHVKQIRATGYRKTLPGIGSPGYDVTLAANESVAGKNFGNTTNVYLAGVAYNDANSNGVKDAGEAAMMGVVINVISNNTVVATRTTDAAGFWQVKGLSAGTGEVDVVLPPGFVATNPASGKYSGSSTSGQQFGYLNFGLHQAAAPLPAMTNSSILTVDEDRIELLV